MRLMRALFSGWFSGIMMGYAVCAVIHWEQTMLFNYVDRIILCSSLVMALALTYLGDNTGG